MAAAVDNVAAPAVESKSARKKAAKANAGTNGTIPAVPAELTKEASAAADSDASNEHPHLRELQKQIRNVTKKLSASQKIDAILAEHSGASLDELVAQRKINQDQKAAALKKPQLQAQLAQLEEQAAHYRKFDADYQSKFSKQREELTAAHQKELDELRSSTNKEATESGASDLRKKLLIFSQFLRAAAAKRTIEEEVDTDESKAFEGALLLVYGGDDKAVDTAVSLIEGSDEQVPSIDGIPTPVTFSQVKKASIDHAPFQAEEAWIDSVEEARGGQPAEAVPGANGSDPTIANAGLTELSADNTVSNGEKAAAAAPGNVGDVAGNAAGEHWHTEAAGATEQGGLEESYEIVPRPADEVNVPAAAPVASSQKPQGLNWADEPPTYELATGNQAGEAWDTKAAGDQTDNSAIPANVTAPADDGFHEVPGRNRGRGGFRGGRGDGEFRGRGGRRGNFRPRGDGEFRGGRGGRGGNRGDGEYRGGRGGGRGGRGGPRGGAEASRGGS